MNCPRCNVAVAFTKNRCDNCGQELRSYRKTVSLSNSFYNLALSQAKVRDLSGAIVSLKQSLQFNKLNTSARNLLGLIYYEEGEIVAALSEWVLSIRTKIMMRKSTFVKFSLIRTSWIRTIRRSRSTTQHCRRQSMGMTIWRSSSSKRLSISTRILYVQVSFWHCFI